MQGFLWAAAGLWAHWIMSMCHWKKCLPAHPIFFKHNKCYCSLFFFLKLHIQKLNIPLFAKFQAPLKWTFFLSKFHPLQKRTFFLSEIPPLQKTNLFLSESEPSQNWSFFCVPQNWYGFPKWGHLWITTFINKQKVHFQKKVWFVKAKSTILEPFLRKGSLKKKRFSFELVWPLKS